MQPSPGRPVTQTDATRANRAQRAEQRQRLQEEIGDALSVFNAALGDLSERYDVSLHDVREMAHVGVRQETVKRPPTLWNACCSLARDAQPNADWRDITKDYAPPIYERVTKRSRSDSDDEMLTAAEERLKVLKTRHDTSVVPKLPSKSKKGVQAEVTRVLNAVETQLQTLNAAYNLEYALFTTRSKREARYAPSVIASATAQLYFTNELRREVNDIVLDLEGYCVYGPEAAAQRLGKQSGAKHHISATLTQQLAELTGAQNARISWASPDALARTHGVVLTGWPAHIPFQSMAAMRKGPAEEIWGLVKDGTIRYERVERATEGAHTADTSRTGDGATSAIPTPTSLPSASAVTMHVESHPNYSASVVLPQSMSEAQVADASHDPLSLIPQTSHHLPLPPFSSMYNRTPPPSQPLALPSDLLPPRPIDFQSFVPGFPIPTPPSQRTDNDAFTSHSTMY